VRGLILAAVAAACFAGGAHAQMSMGAPSAAAPFGSPISDELTFTHLIIDQLEGRLDGSNSLRWDAEGWSGTDELKLWLKSEGERDASGRVEDGQQEALLAKPITTFWDLQLGGRYDLDSGPGRAWAALGVEGLAPGLFHVVATAYAGEHGVAGKAKISYDLLLTNRLILQPEAELNAYSETDRARHLGAGVSDLDAGLRLRYEITRKFAPYLGVAFERRFGQTAALTTAAHLPANATRLTVGVSAWF
jgi:copper resistance protein B